MHEEIREGLREGMEAFGAVRAAFKEQRETGSISAEKRAAAQDEVGDLLLLGAEWAQALELGNGLILDAAGQEMKLRAADTRAAAEAIAAHDPQAILPGQG